jgi:hypothetical protein
LVVGDVLGNAGLYVPIGFAIALGLAAAAAFLASRPELGDCGGVRRDRGGGDDSGA